MSFVRMRQQSALLLLAALKPTLHVFSIGKQSFCILEHRESFKRTCQFRRARAAPQRRPSRLSYRSRLGSVWCWHSNACNSLERFPAWMASVGRKVCVGMRAFDGICNEQGACKATSSSPQRGRPTTSSRRHFAELQSLAEPPKPRLKPAKPLKVSLPELFAALDTQPGLLLLPGRKVRNDRKGALSSHCLAAAERLGPLSLGRRGSGAKAELE